MKIIRQWIDKILTDERNKMYAWVKEENRKYGEYWLSRLLSLGNDIKQVAAESKREKENRLLALKRAADKAREFRESMCEWKNDSALENFNTDNRLSSLDQRWAEIEGRLFKIERQLKALSNAE